MDSFTKHCIANFAGGGGCLAFSFVDISPVAVVDFLLKIAALGTTAYTTYCVYQDRKAKNEQQKNK